MGQAVIVGGGISGLSAAYDLARAGVPYTLLEAQPRAGGVIQTQSIEGCVVEAGPDSFISQKPEALALIKELGMEQEVIGSNDHSRITYIVRHGRLTRMPEGMMMIAPSRAWPMLKSPLLGWGTKLRMARELLRKPPAAPLPDRSVAEFVIDHFGPETLEYLAEPLLAGVYGGDPAQLSAPSVLGRFVDWETRYGSLGRAAMQQRSPAPSAAGGTLFRSLRNGMGSLARALLARVTVQRGEAQTVERCAAGFRVRVDGDWIEADHLILACPAWSAGSILAAFDPALAARIGEIPYTSSLTVALGYRASEFDGRRAGHGFLIPRKERRRMAACTYVDTKFDHRAPRDRVLLRCFFGGAGDEAVSNESDPSLVTMAREELRVITGLTAAPVFTSISRWPRSMAQYTVGHAARWKEIQARLAAIPGLHLAGNAYTGIGIPDCIRMGRAAAAIVAHSR